MTEERELDLIDFLAEVIRHWRGAFICLLIGALCAGAFSFMKSTPTAPAASEEEIEKEIAEMTDEERAAVESALSYDEFYVLAKEYEDNAVVMRFDHHSVPVVRITFAVEAEEDLLYDITGAYQTSFSKAGLSDKLREKTDIDEDISDLISLVLPSVSSEKGFRYFTVVCAYPEEDKCAAIGEVIEEYMLEKATVLKDGVGEHVLKAINSDIVVSEDWSYQSKQQSIREKTISQKNNVLNAVKNLNEVQKECFVAQSTSDLWEKQRAELAEAVEKEQESANTEAQPAAQSRKISLKLTLVGALAFSFLYLFFWAVKYILDGHIKTSDDLMELVQYPQIGTICTAKEPAFVIDKLIFSLKHHGQRLFAPEKSVELIASNLAVNAKKKGVKSVTIVGCDLEVKAGEYCRKLAETLRETSRIETNVLDDVVYNQKSVEALSESESIVMVETAGNTLYSDLEKEVQLIRQMNIEVLGGVIVE